MNFEEYLTHTKKNGKLPYLLLDIFKYLGAVRYVKAVHESDPRSIMDKTVDSEVLTVATVPSLYKSVDIQVENDIRQYKLRFGEAKVEQFWQAFRKLAVNRMKTDIDIVATYDSICSNFSTVFGVHNEFLAKILYLFLSDGYHGKDIRLNHFISKFEAFSSLLDRDLFNF